MSEDQALPDLKAKLDLGANEPPQPPKVNAKKSTNKLLMR